MNERPEILSVRNLGGALPKLPALPGMDKVRA
jgi:hypothetical protein